MDYLKIIPREWKCPFCGQLHPYKKEDLQYYKDRHESIFLYCENEIWAKKYVRVQVVFLDEGTYLHINRPCKSFYDDITYQFSVDKIGNMIEFYKEIKKDIRGCLINCNTCDNVTCVCYGCAYTDVCIMHRSCIPSESSSSKFKVMIRFGFVF